MMDAVMRWMPNRRSLPARGAWIEIYGVTPATGTKNRSLPARGAWIEISSALLYLAAASRRSPHGERGLKYLKYKYWNEALTSLPARGAWIEMMIKGVTSGKMKPSLPARGAWIEIFDDKHPAGLVVRRSPHGERGLKLI